MFRKRHVSNISTDTRLPVVKNERPSCQLRLLFGGLAEIYRGASDPADQMLAAAIAITAAAGFRVGELLTLPHDCEIEEERSGKPRYGLRYYKEKNKGDEKLFAVRWLTPIQTELARDAIKRIRSLTEAFRRRAQVLETNPNRIPISEEVKSEHLTAARMSHF